MQTVNTIIVFLFIMFIVFRLNGQQASFASSSYSIDIKIHTDSTIGVIIYNLTPKIIIIPNVENHSIICDSYKYNCVSIGKSDFFPPLSEGYIFPVINIGSSDSIVLERMYSAGKGCVFSFDYAIVDDSISSISCKEYNKIADFEVFSFFLSKNLDFEYVSPFR
jgi:hypothetical protein